MILRDRLQSAFDAAGAAATLAAAALLVWAQPALRPTAPPPPPATMQISITQGPPAAPPPAPTPEPPKPEPPKQMAVPKPPPPLPKPKRATPVMHKILRREVPPAAIASAALSAPDMPTAATLSGNPGPATNVTGADGPVRDYRIEDAYLGALHAYIAARTSPPDTAAYRLTHPSGEAQLRIVLARDGRVIEVSLLRGSGSAMLDARALEILRGGHYQPFPQKCFAGESTHNFIVRIEFRPSGTDF